MRMCKLAFELRALLENIIPSALVHPFIALAVLVTQEMSVRIEPGLGVGPEDCWIPTFRAGVVSHKS